MRDNFYVTAILICACIMLLAGLAFTGLEILHYTSEPELPPAPPAQERTMPQGETREESSPAAPSEAPEKPSEVPAAGE